MDNKKEANHRLLFICSLMLNPPYEVHHCLSRQTHRHRCKEHDKRLQPVLRFAKKRGKLLLDEEHVCLVDDHVQDVYRGGKVAKNGDRFRQGLAAKVHGRMCDHQQHQRKRLNHCAHGPLARAIGALLQQAEQDAKEQDAEQLRRRQAEVSKQAILVLADEDAHAQHRETVEPAIAAEEVRNAVSDEPH